MGQNNDNQLLRDAFRAIADGQQVMIQAMQAMMARLEVQNRIQPIRREERGKIDGCRKRSFENFVEPSFQREQQRHVVGLPREFKQPPYNENQNRRKASLRVEIPEFKSGMNSDDYADGTLQVDDVSQLKEVPLEIPKGFEGLPLAPELRPTDTECADPIVYISKIEKEASAFGICKVISPLPKPSKKYVPYNLNRTLAKSLELGSDTNVKKINDGYHEGDKDYKVVRKLYSFHNVHQKLRPRAEVYGLRQNRWTSVKVQINVYKMPPDLNSSQLNPPQNWQINGTLNPDYQCGPPVWVSPSEFPDLSGLLPDSVAIASWQVVCNITQPKGAAPKCCVSFSAYYNESIIPCPTCACGCSSSSTHTCSSPRWDL